jgi:hypothetical protein
MGNCRQLITYNALLLKIEYKKKWAQTWRANCGYYKLFSQVLS